MLRFGIPIVFQELRFLPIFNQRVYTLSILFSFLKGNNCMDRTYSIAALTRNLFTYLYLRVIKLSVLASLFGAVSYGISGFMTVWLEYNTVGHIMAWFPLALYAIEHFNPTLLTLSITLSLLSGHPQVALYAILFISLYAAYRLQGKNKLYALLSLFVGFGISAIQLVPGIELLRVAARANHSYEQMMKTILIQPWQILMAFFPNLYGNPVSRTYWPLDTYVGKVTSIGLVPLFFLLSALRFYKITLVRFYALSVLILGIYITANPITALLYSFSIPIISSSSPTLSIFIFSFCLSVLTAFGVDGWIQETHSVKKLIIRAIEVCAGILFIASIFILFPSLKIHATVALRALFYGGAISGLTLSIFYIAIRYKK